MLLRPLLALLEIPYRAWMWLRNKGYDLGWFASSKPQESFIVSVGNLSVGGSGKTPLTELLTRELLALQGAATSQSLDRPFPFAVLSRGYRSSKKKHSLLFQTPLQNTDALTLPSPLECGDEPYLLARKLPGIWFGIGKNRCESALQLKEKGACCFILDDGFQHRRLKRDCDIVLLDAEKPFANHHLIPRGSLREPPAALCRATAIVLYPVRDLAQFTASCQQIAPYSNAPVIGMEPTFTGAFSIEGQWVPWSKLQGADVAILCGIARPRRFVDNVRALGLTIVAEKILSDHASIPLDQLVQFAKNCLAKGARYILCTEKDAVKWMHHPDLPAFPTLPIPLLFLRLELKVVAGQEKWDALVHSIYQAIPLA